MFIKLTNGSGRILRVNPNRITFFYNVDDGDPSIVCFAGTRDILTCKETPEEIERMLATLDFDSKVDKLVRD